MFSFQNQGGLRTKQLLPNELRAALKEHSSMSSPFILCFLYSWPSGCEQWNSLLLLFLRHNLDFLVNLLQIICFVLHCNNMLHKHPILSSIFFHFFPFLFYYYFFFTNYVVTRKLFFEKIWFFSLQNAVFIFESASVWSHCLNVWS